MTSILDSVVHQIKNAAQKIDVPQAFRFHDGIRHFDGALTKLRKSFLAGNPTSQDGIYACLSQNSSSEDPAVLSDEGLALYRRGLMACKVLAEPLGYTIHESSSWFQFTYQPKEGEDSHRFVTRNIYYSLGTCDLENTRNYLKALPEVITFTKSFADKCGCLVAFKMSAGTLYDHSDNLKFYYYNKKFDALAFYKAINTIMLKHSVDIQSDRSHTFGTDFKHPENKHDTAFGFSSSHGMRISQTASKALNKLAETGNLSRQQISDKYLKDITSFKRLLSLASGVSNNVANSKAAEGELVLGSSLELAWGNRVLSAEYFGTDGWKVVSVIGTENIKIGEMIKFPEGAKVGEALTYECLSKTMVTGSQLDQVKINGVLKTQLIDRATIA